MPARSRSKNGVASLAFVAGILVLTAKPPTKPWMAGTSPAMTKAVERARCARTWTSERRVGSKGAQRRAHVCVPRRGIPGHFANEPFALNVAAQQRSSEEAFDESRNRHQSRLSHRRHS